MSEKTPILLTIRQFCERHPWPSEKGLRWLIFNEKTNGFSRCVVRCGRRVLIDEEQFFAWLSERNGKVA